jgi:hypothetical protein
MSETTPGSKAVRFSVDLCHYHLPASLGHKFQEYPAPVALADQVIDFPIPKDLATEYPHKASFFKKLKLLFL